MDIGMGARVRVDVNERECVLKEIEKENTTKDDFVLH